MKDVDTDRNAHILKYFLLVFPFLAFLGLVLKGILGVLIAIPVSAAVSAVSGVISGLIGGGSVNLLYGTDRRNIDIRDQLSGTMSQARCHKMSKDYEKALTFIDDVLDQDPDYPEALFLKAQILSEGFGKSVYAKNCLKKIIDKETSDDEPVYLWASTLYDEIERADKS